jgi:hypothetical protein
VPNSTTILVGFVEIARNYLYHLVTVAKMLVRRDPFIMEPDDLCFGQRREELPWLIRVPSLSDLHRSHSHDYFKVGPC